MLVLPEGCFFVCLVCKYCRQTNKKTGLLAGMTHNANIYGITKSPDQVRQKSKTKNNFS